MKLSKLFPCALTLWAVCAVAYPTNEFHPLVSDDSKHRYMDALSEAHQNNYQPALAKLESMLMVDEVSIGIDTQNLPKDAKGYTDSVQKGISIWCDALPDCPYRMVNNAREHPAVLVKFVKSLDEKGADLQGMIKAQHEFRWTGSKHASTLTCTLYVVYRCDSRNLSHTEAAEVVAHELGHLLGLGDADVEDGLMGPFIAGHPRLRPSEAELEALVQLRQTVRAEIDKIEDQL